jgi:hypothetical protein
MLVRVMGALVRVAVLLVTCAALSTFGAEETQAQTYAAAGDAEAIIRATWPDHEEDIAIAVAACETGLGEDVLNEASGAYGLFQMLPSTAYAMGTDYSLLGDPYYASQEAARLQDEMGWSPWVCAA